MRLRTLGAAAIVSGLVLLIGLTAGAPDDRRELADPGHLGPRLVVVSLAATALVGLGLFALSSTRPWLRAAAMISMVLLGGVIVGLFEDLPEEAPVTPPAQPPPAGVLVEDEAEPPPDAEADPPPDDGAGGDGWSATGEAVLAILRDLWVLVMVGTVATTAVLLARHLLTRAPVDPLDTVAVVPGHPPLPPADLDEARSRVADALERSISGLADGDPRTVVLDAYVRMTDALAEQGIRREASDTPLEYLGRALTSLSASVGAIRQLTDLLEVAMFSTRPVDRSMAEQAVAAFDRVRDELRSPAWVGGR